MKPAKQTDTIMERMKRESQEKAAAAKRAADLIAGGKRAAELQANAQAEMRVPMNSIATPDPYYSSIAHVLNGIRFRDTLNKNQAMVLAEKELHAILGRVEAYEYQQRMELEKKYEAALSELEQALFDEQRRHREDIQAFARRGIRRVLGGEVSRVGQEFAPARGQF